MATITIKVNVADEVMENRKFARKVIAEVLGNEDVIDAILVRVTKAKGKVAGPKQPKPRPGAVAIRRKLKNSKVPLTISQMSRQLHLSSAYVRTVLEELIYQGLVERYQSGNARKLGSLWSYLWKANEAQMEYATRPDEVIHESENEQVDEKPLNEPVEEKAEEPVETQPQAQKPAWFSSDAPSMDSLPYVTKDNHIGITI